MSPEERAHERALAMVLAGRRDALLLLLGQGFLLSWGWSRGALAAAAASVAALALYLVLIPMLAQAREARGWLDLRPASAGRLPDWTTIVGLLGALAAPLVGGQALSVGLGSRFLTIMVAGLLLAWELWLYVWSLPADGAPTTER